MTELLEHLQNQLRITQALRDKWEIKKRRAKLYTTSMGYIDGSYSGRIITLKWAIAKIEESNNV